MSADYTTEVVDGVLCIVDENLGNTSVTNDIDNIIMTLLFVETLKPGMPCIYRDSEGLWDEVVHGDNGFIKFRSLNCRFRADAVMVARGHPDNVVIFRSNSQRALAALKEPRR
jgi:hypothetical protein